MKSEDGNDVIPGAVDDNIVDANGLPSMARRGWPHVLLKAATMAMATAKAKAMAMPWP